MPKELETYLHEQGAHPKLIARIVANGITLEEAQQMFKAAWEMGPPPTTVVQSGGAEKLTVINYSTSHARMTRSMRCLPGGTYKVLATLRWLIPDGARRKVSHDMIRRVAQVSESTVSAAMDKLDGAFIIRHSLGKGRGNGYEIEMLVPPEQRPVAPRKGSISDPSQRSFFSGITMPQEAEKEGSNIDPCIFYLPFADS